MRERTKERLESFWKGPTIDRVIALGGMVGLAAFAWLFGEVVRMATDYPAPLAAVCAVSFLLGVLLAYVLGIRDVRLERRRERRKAEAAAAARERHLYRSVRNMNYGAKVALYGIYRTGEACFVGDDDLYDECRCERAQAIEECDLLGSETVPGGSIYSLTPEGRAFIDAHPELFEVAKASWREMNGGD